MKPEPQIYFDKGQVEEFLRTKFSPKVITCYRKWLKSRRPEHGEMIYIFKGMEDEVQPPVRSVVDFLFAGLGNEIRLL